MKKWNPINLSSFVIWLLVILSVNCLPGCEEKSGEYKLVLKLSHVFSPKEQLTISMDAVAASILKKTNGAIEIQTFPQGQIATYKDGMEQVVRGANFISVEDPSYLGDYVPEFTALGGNI